MGSRNDSRRVDLKFLAAHLGLSPSTISFVLNDTPGRSIPEVTRERIRKAAIEFNYQPSMIARNLRGMPTQTLGILLPELGEGYHSQVLNGMADLLMEEGYFYFIVHHRHKPDLIEAYPNLLRARGVDGILAIDTHLCAQPRLPTVLIAGHTELAKVTNVVLDHERAAQIGLEYLYRAGHRRIVFIKGQAFSTDTEQRWDATVRTAKKLGIPVDESLVVELAVDSTSPEISYPGIHALIERKAAFTAVVSFNDVSAMGCIRALHERGLRVPEDVSVLGFDDIQSAAFQVPSLSTIRQPLRQMGRLGAELLLRKLRHEKTPDVVRVEPEMVVRESTAPVRQTAPKSRAKAAPTR